MSSLQDHTLFELKSESGSKKYKKLLKHLLNMGYTPGLTLYIVPYDWRKPVGVNDAALRIKKSVDKAWDITGKKTVISKSKFIVV